AEEPFEDGGFEISRIHIETDLLRGFNATARNLKVLCLTGNFASVSGAVASKDGHVRLHSSAYVYEQTREMWDRLLLSTTAVQVTQSHIEASTLASMLEAQPDVSSHPENGARETQDEMLQVIEQVIRPLGEGASQWTAEDFEQA